VLLDLLLLVRGFTCEAERVGVPPFERQVGERRRIEGVNDVVREARMLRLLAVQPREQLRRFLLLREGRGIAITPR
jgi:hypothetical protein